MFRQICVFCLCAVSAVAMGDEMVRPLDSLRAFARVLAPNLPYTHCGKYYQDCAEPPARTRFSQAPTGNRIEYDYNYGFDHPNQDRISIGIKINDKNILNWKDNLIASVRYKDLSDCGKTKEASFPVKIGENGKATIDISGLTPNRVYEFDNFNFFGKDPLGVEKPKLLNSMGLHYYGVTTDDDKVNQARFKIATHALQEVYERKMGRFSDGVADYMRVPGYDYSGGACGLQQASCSKPFIRTYDQDQSNAYQYRGKLIEGSEFRKLAGLRPIHGSYYKSGNHKGTILSYCPATDTAWTIDWATNQLNIIERPHPAFSSIGVITEGMLYR